MLLIALIFYSFTKLCSQSVKIIFGTSKYVLKFGVDDSIYSAVYDIKSAFHVPMPIKENCVRTVIVNFLNILFN